jgi:hypothetical protein
MQDIFFLRRNGLILFSAAMTEIYWGMAYCMGARHLQGRSKF